MESQYTSILYLGERSITPEMIRNSIQHIAARAQSDPEAFHGDKDHIYTEVLQLIAAGKLADPAGCSAAVLELENIVPKWSACA